MNLFKKTTASIALVTLVSSIMSTGVSANSSTEIEAANALAAAGYINNHSDDTAAYNLNQNVLRQEIAAVARGIAGLEKTTEVKGIFSDVTATAPNTWAVYSVEALAEAGLIAKNAKFNPEANISKAEAVGMMVKAAFGDEYSYDSTNSDSWMKQVVDFAVSKGVVSSFTNYDTAATRGFVFEAGNNAMVASSEVVEACDEVSQLLGLCDSETETETETNTGTTTPVVSGDNMLMAELSAKTPAGSDLPAGADGVTVLTADLTAGSEDVSVTAMTIGRTGFGETAATSVAVYTDEGRASKAKSFNSDDEANVTFSPAVVIKAGETRTVKLRVNTTTGNYGEFALSIKDITASSTVESATIVGNYFDVKNTTVTKLTAASGSVSTYVTLGEEAADIAKFKLTNEGDVANSDVSVSSVTLKAIGDIDEEVELSNFALEVAGNVISTVPSMDGKYITFNFDGITIADGKNETFVVTADIIGGANKKISFLLETEADIEATASKYVGVNIVNEFTATSEVTVQAGDVSIYSIDATADEVRADKKDIVLGQIKVVNTAGKNLEIKDLLVNITTGSGINTVLENVEVEINGTSYDLDSSISLTSTAATANFSQTDLDVVLPQGTTMLTIIADTKKDLTEQNITLALPTDGLKIIETEDDVAAAITPASLSFDNLTVKLSGATVSNVNLANTKVVKGASDIVALQFEVEAANASDVVIDEMVVGITASGSVATKNHLSQATLYKGSVSEANVLDRVSSTKFSSSTGTTVTFDGFNTVVKADATETFIVTVTTVDTTTVEGIVLNAKLTSVSAEDDENDTITVTGLTTAIGDKNITVVGSGKVTLTADANNIDNKDAKTILAGEEKIVYSVDSLATNEGVDVETVVVTFNKDVKKVVKTAKLYLGDTVVATASNSDVASNGLTITFDNISNLTFTTDSKELKVAILTETIGYEKIGQDATTGITVDSIVLSDATGADSNEKLAGGDIVTVGSISAAAAKFDVVPATVTLATVSSFDGTKAKFSVTSNDGENTATGSNTAVSIDLTNLDFVIGGNYTGDFKLYVDNKSSNSVTGSIVSGKVSFNETAIDSLYGSGVITSKETFVLEIIGTTTDKNVSITMPTNAASYVATNVSATTTLTSNMTNEVELGSKTY